MNNAEIEIIIRTSVDGRETHVRAVNRSTQRVLGDWYITATGMEALTIKVTPTGTSFDGDAA
jgi:hypothetical protein